MNDVQKLLFQVTRMLKINIKEQTKSTELTITLNFGFVRYVRLDVCSIHDGKMRHCIIHTSHHDKELQTPKLFPIYLVVQITDVQKSRFQVTKMLKINIMKNSTTKNRSDDSFKMLIRHVFMIAILFNHHLKMRHFRFHTTHHDKFPNTQTVL